MTLPWTAELPYRVTFTMPAANVAVCVSATQTTVSSWGEQQEAFITDQTVALTADLTPGEKNESALIVPKARLLLST